MKKWIKILAIPGMIHFVMCFSPTLFAQDSVRVTGTIISGRGLPLEGVSVSVEGVSATPAITDSSGSFQLISPEPDVWLMIMPAGKFKSRRIYLNNRNEITLQLTPVDLQSGYDHAGNIFRPELRRNFLSAYSAPNTQDLLFYPNQSIDQNFQGNIPGWMAIMQSGMPGAGVTTYLRGMRSMYTTSQPLYIVDGLPLETPGMIESELSGYAYNPVSSLDPMDITNITVLKDYQVTAIYGMRGSNGVVLVETLKPTEVRTTIDFSFRTGISMQPDQLPQLNGQHYKTLANEVLMSSGMFEEVYRESYFPLFTTEDDPEHYKYNNDYNWQKEIFRNALLNDFYLRVRGGDEIARYGLSVGYLNHKGIIKETDFSRFNVRFVGAFNVFQWLRLNMSSNLITSNSNLRESSLSEKTSPIATSLFKSPLLYPYKFDDEGQELKTPEEVNSLGVSNPVAVINSFEGKNRNYRFNTSFRAEANLWQDYIKWTSMLGINFNSVNENVFKPNKGMERYFENEAWNVSTSLKNYLYAFYTDNFLSYKQEFNNRHLVSAAVGLRIYQNRFQIDWGLIKNAHEGDEYRELENGPKPLKELGGETSRWNRLGVYSTAGYSYRNKYFFNASLIPEFSSRIGVNAEDIWMIGGRPFGVFYSLGAAWRLSGETFIRDIYWLEDLKFRASYGQAGNDDIGNLTSMDYVTVVKYRETSGLIPGTITDRSLKFETNKQYNIGLDLSLFGNRLHFAFDHYKTKTEDLLVFEPQPSYTGFTIIPANNGEISNTGWEVGLNARVFDLERVKWDIGFNLSTFNNVVEAIKDGGVVTPFEGGQYFTRVGSPILSFYGYQYKGVYATASEAAAYGLKTEKGIPFGAGDAIYEDLAGPGPDGTPDGIINELDRTVLGSPVPDLFGGISSIFRYGRWSLSANLQFVLGNEVFNYLRYQNERMTNLNNQSTNTLNRWTTEGQETDVPRALYGDPIGNADFSSRWIEDGSYLRLKHVTIAYTIPEQILFTRNLQVYATATNLYTWKRYLGYDPEFSFSYRTMEQGIDYGLMPQTHRFMIGIRIGL